jgi:hypothetical protein
LIQHTSAIEEINMTTTMVFPRTRPQQSSYLYSQQTTAQQTSGIDISSLMTMMKPAMMVGMMGKMI